MFFLFLTFGLYQGLVIRDDLSRKLGFKWQNSKSSILTPGTHVPDNPVSFDGGDDIAGILISIVLWLVVTILFVLFLILLEVVLWAGALAFVGLIYWILMRALKLIFSKSEECKDNFFKSLAYGLGYTLLYTSWIYGVIYLSSIF